MGVKPYELTVEQVVGELEQVIAQYPNRLGGDIDDDQPENGLQCVYYKDETGFPISNTFADESGNYPPVRLVEPVCIIGQWIESFHPEFKEDEVVNRFLVRNSIVSALAGAENPFSYEVRDVLGEIQGQQDDGRTWGEISFEW